MDGPQGKGCHGSRKSKVRNKQGGSNKRKRENGSHFEIQSSGMGVGINGGLLGKV